MCLECIISSRYDVAINLLIIEIDNSKGSFQQSTIDPGEPRHKNNLNET